MTQTVFFKREPTFFTVNYQADDLFEHFYESTFKSTFEQVV